MDCKKILILGGNKAQVPLIQAAQREGYYVVLVDYTETNPGIAFCDKHYQENFVEKEKVLEIANKENVGGVISNSEAAMPIVAYVSEKMGLIGNSYKSVIELSSKSSFREAQKTVSAYCPNSFVTTDFDDALNKAKKLKFPIIMKPGRSSGSRGVTVIKKYEDFISFKNEYDLCGLYSMNKNVIIEEFLTMKSIDSVIDGDIFICNGLFFWDGLFTSKRSVKAPNVPMTQTYPIVLKKEQIEEVKQQVISLFHYLGIKHGEYNIEMFYTDENKLFCIEINARQGGNGIPQVIKKHCGVDMYKMLVTTAMGDNSYFDSVLTQNKQLKFISRHVVFSHCNGTYNGLFISDKIKPFVDEIVELKNDKDSVNDCSNATDVIAYVDLVFNNRENQLFFVDKIEDYIYPIVHKGPNL